VTGLTQEQLAKMKHEMSNLLGQYKMVEQPMDRSSQFSSGQGLSAQAPGKRVRARYLKQRHPDVLAEFEAIVQTV